MAINTSYIITLLTIGTVYAIVASSLNLVTGYAGLVSLGHAAFLAVGAYTEAILTTKYGLPFLAAFPSAIVVGALLGALLGLPSLRVSDDFLAVATIGINFIVVAILRSWDFVGGTLGIGNIPKPTLVGVTLDNGGLFVLSAVMLGVTVFSSWWLQRSWAGLALAALRDDQEAAESVSISTARFKIVAFTLSGAFAGVAGALYAHYFGFIDPGSFGFLLSVDIMVYAVLGGLGTLWGPVVGAYVLYIVPKLFRFVGNYRIVLYGLLLAIVIVWEPNGIVGIYDRARSRLGGSTTVTTDGGDPND